MCSRILTIAVISVQVISFVYKDVKTFKNQKSIHLIAVVATTTSQITFSTVHSQLHLTKPSHGQPLILKDLYDHYEYVSLNIMSHRDPNWLHVCVIVLEKHNFIFSMFQIT